MKTSCVKFCLATVALLATACGGGSDASADPSDAGVSGTADAACPAPTEDQCPTGQMCMSMDQDFCVTDGQQCVDPALVGSCPAGQMCMAMDQDFCVTAGNVCVGGRKNYVIQAQVPHAHLFTQVGIVFTVRDLDQCTDAADVTTCTAIPGLPLEAFFSPKGATAPIVQPILAGTFDDMGDGTYTWMRTIGEYGAAAVGASFTQNGQLYTAAFGMESSKAGGERYFCDTNADGTNDRSLQVRWNASVPRPVADGQDEVFSFELMGSTNTPINEEKPWLNTFENLRPTEVVGNAPMVELMADTAATSTSLGMVPVAYAGKGIYNVTRAFVAADLGGQDTRTFWFKVNFTDDKGCAIAAGVGDDEANYHFPVAAN